MAQMENWLSGGDLRSNGASDEDARVIIQNPELIPDLIASLDAEDAVVRGRARKAMAVLTKPHAGLPPGWVKSEHLG